MTNRIWFIFLAAASAWSAPFDLGDALETLREEHHLPGLAAAVVEEGDVIAQGVCGLRRVERDTPVEIADRWHIGSCTKSMTATLVGVMVDQGLLRWDMTVAEALPELAPEMRPAWKHVTIDHLLRHLAGTPGVKKPDSSFTGAPRTQRAEFAKLLVHREPLHEAGRIFEYSNDGYGLLGAILDEASGITYEELLDGYLFKPLGLGSAGLGPPAIGDAEGQPWGHRADTKGWHSVEPSSEIGFRPAHRPAGCVHLSIGDFAHYAAWVATNEPRILSDGTFAHLQTPPEGGSYAAGIWQTEVPGTTEPAMAHTGHMSGFSAVFYAGKKHSVVVAINTGGGGREWIGDVIAEAAVKAALNVKH